MQMSRKCLGLIGILVLVLAALASAQAPDPLVGTWRLNVAKSTYKPGPAPKSATVVIDAVGKGKGIKVAVDAVNADGSPLKFSFTTERDGKDVPVVGNPNYDTAASVQASPTTGTTTYKKGGKVVVTVKTEVSKDGKILTTTSDGTNPQGQTMHNVAVYEKQ